MATKKKKSVEELREKTRSSIRQSAKFRDLRSFLHRFERTVSVLKKPVPFKITPDIVAAVSLHFGKIPTELDPEQIHDYLFLPSEKIKNHLHSRILNTPVYGTSISAFKSEGLEL